MKITDYHKPVISITFCSNEQYEIMDLFCPHWELLVEQELKELEKMEEKHE